MFKETRSSIIITKRSFSNSGGTVWSTTSTVKSFIGTSIDWKTFISNEDRQDAGTIIVEIGW
ncbi:hypothetical protein E1B28_005618 [Marasmius oreades]|uniref:Uncharacterized protein n=1 Tax=Marasmius oreades TaxID=181124 RepID=A0A9P7UW77_9AGAR|nr:uncharacterized protein E1B28_005618 [Marasmius oreades]KAG7094804.1 hypothetical protein E1B28_005618 [Marasmius oreades]